MMTDEFTKDIFQDEKGNKLDFRFFSPLNVKNMKYPLVIYLHSEDECGSDNQVLLTGLPAVFFALPDQQEKRPCFVLAPQCSEGKLWDDSCMEQMLISLIHKMVGENSIDANRIYIHGVSMGAMGVWNLIAKHPKTFAAALPVSGFGDPYAVANARFVPVWAFHAPKDPVVPACGEVVMGTHRYLSGTRNLVDALRNAGSAAVRYTEYNCSNDAPDSRFECENIYRDGEAARWLFSQNRIASYEVNWIKPGVWNIEDYSGDSCYLIEGTKKALLIDTGFGSGNFKETVAELTPLPIELAVTHAHPDHIMHASEYDMVYLGEKEIDTLPQVLPRVSQMAGSHKVKTEGYTPVKEGSTIDLGGGTVIEVLEISGHTQGSVAYVDTKHGVIATGDAIGSGSGVWMQVPMSTSILEYRENLKHFSKKLKEYDTLLFLSGHRIQDGRIADGAFYNPLNTQVIEDMIILCDMVLNNEAELEEYPFSFAEQAYIAKYKTASMVFEKSRLLK